MGQLIIFAAAAAFLLMGLIALARPTEITARFALKTIPPEMKNEVRAVYGGFGVAVAGLLTASSSLPAWRDGIVLTVAIFTLGMAAGRVISLAFERPKGPFPYVFLGVEVVAGGALLAAMGS